MELARNIFEYLNTHCCYAVLRNYEELPETNLSRDIDIIIDKSEFKGISKRLVNVAIESGFKVISYYKSDRLVTFVFGSSYNSTIDLIQFDFFFHTSLYGLVAIEASTMLKDRKFNGNVYHVSKEIEFLDKYIYGRLVNQPYPEKYKALYNSMLSNETISSALHDIFNIESVIEVEQCKSKDLFRRKFFSCLKRNPIKHLNNLLLFWFFYFRNYINSSTGLQISFTGADGAGKTTVIDGICNKLSNLYASATAMFHFRPAVFSNLGETAHSLGLKQEVDRNFNKPHRGNKTTRISSIARLLYYSLDYIIGYFVKVKPVCKLTRLLIFDRYFTDIVADSRRSRIFLNHRFLYWFGRIFIPKLDYNILLTADKNIILSRKQELNGEGVDTINKKLEYLSKKKGYYLVINNRTPEEAVQKILTIVFEGQHRKNLKRLGI